MLSLLKNFRLLRVKGPVAAGQTAVKSDGVDMAGAQSCLFVVGLGTLSAGNVTTVKLQGSNTDVDGNYVDLASSSYNVQDSEDNLLALIEIIKPKYRYVRVVVTPATANGVIDLIIAMVGVTLRNLPVTQSTSHCTHYGNLSVVSPSAA